MKSIYCHCLVLWFGVSAVTAYAQGDRLNGQFPQPNFGNASPGAGNGAVNQFPNQNGPSANSATFKPSGFQGSPQPSFQQQNFQQGNLQQGTQPRLPQQGVRVAQNQNRQVNNIEPAEGSEFKPGKVVANVGGFPIFRADVIAEINQLIEMNLAKAPKHIKDQQRELALPFAVGRAIEQKLLYVDAVRSLPDQTKLPEIKQQIREQFAEIRLAELMKQMKAQSPADLENKLRKFGTSLRRVRKAWVDSQFAGFMAREKIIINPEITHLEMLDYYNRNLKDFHFPSQVRWEQIMVRFDKFDSKSLAWKRMGELGNEVIYGANLGAVAKKSSHGFNADKGGYHDWTTKGSLAHDKVDEALFTIPLNRLSDRIESKIGYHIVRVLERKQEGHIPFSKAQSDIREKIRKEKQDASLKEYIEKLKKQIPVENYVKVEKPEKKK